MRHQPRAKKRFNEKKKNPTKNGEVSGAHRQRQLPPHAGSCIHTSVRRENGVVKVVDRLLRVGRLELVSSEYRVSAF